MAVSAPAEAQSQPSSEARGPVRIVAAVSQEQQRARALGARVIALTMPDVEKQILEFVNRMTAELGIADSNPEMAAWFEKNAGPMMMPHLRKMLDDMAVMYGERLTISELEALVGFYDTPMGREIARKDVIMQLDMSHSMTTMQENYLRDFMGAFCKQFDCGEEFGAADAKSGRR